MNNKQLQRFLIIDSNALIHRAFHALPPLTNKAGEPVNAVYGFLLVFFKAIKDLRPDFLVATFDLPLPTFRHKEFDNYKAKRPPTPINLSLQIPKTKEVLTAFDVPIFEKEGFEADDLIGTLCHLVSQQYPEIEAIILSGDLDVLQLVGKNTKTYTFKKGISETTVYDEKAIKERYGILPGQLVDFKALKGDASDNIPGVKGIGEKTALQLIKEFGSLENLYKELERGTEKTENIRALTKEKLINQKDQAFLSRRLSEIRKDVPIALDFESCRWQSYDKEKARKVLEKFEFYSLINKIPQE